MATILDFDEINALGKYVAREYAGDYDSIVSLMFSFLTSLYGRGVEAAGEMLSASTYPLVEEMYASVLKLIDGKTFEDRVREGGRIPFILETEAHRVWHEGLLNGARSTGIPDIRKTWITRMDDRVRDTHDYIHGVTIPMNERFVTFDGDSALAPGGFSRAENNAGCRCVLLLERG